MPLDNLVYIGTYTEPIRFGTGQVLEGKGKGIYVYKFDPQTGSLEFSSLLEGVRNPSYLAFDKPRRFLYAVNEFKEFEGAASGAVSAFAIDQHSGALTYLNTKASHGTDPCHLMIDPSGKFVLVANFASGSICVLPIRADGSLGDASDVVQHQGRSVDPARQAGPHAHAVVMDATGHYVFVPELGLDKVMIYTLDVARGKLVPNGIPSVATKPGAGPRQLVMHPAGPYSYLINELDSTMTTFRYDGGTGGLTPLQTLSTLPADFAGKSTCAEVQISPSGRFLYGSNRGHDSIVTYAIDPSEGTLSLVGHQSSGGKIPRNFEVAPNGRWLLAANQDTGNIVSFTIDAGSGRPVPTGHFAEVPTPICVRFI